MWDRKRATIDVQKIPLYYAEEGGHVTVTTNGPEDCETQLHIVSKTGRRARICVSTAALLRAIAVSQGINPAIFDVGFIDDKREN